jgi:hypothetical protein
LSRPTGAHYLSGPHARTKPGGAEPARTLNRAACSALMAVFTDRAPGVSKSSMLRLPSLIGDTLVAPDAAELNQRHLLVQDLRETGAENDGAWTAASGAPEAANLEQPCLGTWS